MKLLKLLCSALLVVSSTLCSRGNDGSHFGPLWDDFELTLNQGHRTEAAGPFFYDELQDSQHTWAIPPLFSWSKDPALESLEVDFAYPILTYDRYGQQYRWQFFQLLSWAGGPTQTETERKRFTLFPIYFQQRSTDPSQNYTAVGPFYGHLKNRLFKDDVFFVMFPFYSQTRKKDVVTDNYVYPFFHLRHGNGLNGWQFWPLVGQEHKEVTSETNRFGDVSMVPGHDSFFVLWPFYFNHHSGIGTQNPDWQTGVLPIYSLERSPNRDSTTVLWPFFSHVTDREKKYREWDAPWPLIVFARGEGKTTTRVFPLFSRAHTDTLESNWYLWPVYKYNRIHSDPLDRRRTRILFFLYSDTVDNNTETGNSRRRIDFLPFFTYQRAFNGNTRLQVAAPLEPFTSGSHKIERDYSHVWSFWRDERNAKEGKSSQSFFWNLYRRETKPGAKKCSLLFGLFQYQSDSEGRRMRLFYIPMGKSKPASIEKTEAADGGIKKD